MELKWKHKRRSPHNSYVASQVCDADIWGARCSLGFWHFWKMLWKVCNTTHCSFSTQIETVSKKSETRTSLKLFAHPLSHLQVQKVKRWFNLWRCRIIKHDAFHVHEAQSHVLLWDLTLADSRVFRQPHTCNAGPHSTKSSSSISSLCESGALCLQDPIHHIFPCLRTEGNGAIWLPRLSALYGECFL